ncbi:NADH pyrophosphatase [Aureococcus anophagefferens]|nr:NADH pyrophosphatase [Aureococcus anophagefferens]
METEVPTVSEMHRGGAPLELRHCSSSDTGAPAAAAAPAAASAYLEETGAANRSHFCLADCCCAQEPPSKDAVSSYDHYWDCCGCPEIDPQGACGPLACCGCGCKLALCAADVACLCLPRAAGACAERVREASDFKRAHQTRAHFDPYPRVLRRGQGTSRRRAVRAFGGDECLSIKFVTGNAMKLREVEAILSQNGLPLPLEQCDLDLDEYQGVAEDIAAAKCRLARRRRAARR